MTKIDTNSKDIISKKAQDKTDWKKVYSKSQHTIDREAQQDTENPVLKNATFKRMKKNKGVKSDMPHQA